MKPKCESTADLGFILDSSASLKDDFDREKEFVKALVGAVGVGGKQGSRVGVVTFSHEAKLSIKLNEHRNIRSFILALNDIPLTGKKI